MCCPVWGVLWGFWAVFSARPCVCVPFALLPSCVACGGSLARLGAVARSTVPCAWWCVRWSARLGSVCGSVNGAGGGGRCAVPVLARLFYFGRFRAFVLNITFLCHSCAPYFFSLRHPQLDFSKMLFVQ